MGRPAATTKQNEKAATRSRRLETESLLRFRQQGCRFNPDRCGLRVGNSFHLNVVSLVVGELVGVLHGPDFVVAIVVERSRERRMEYAGCLTTLASWWFLEEEIAGPVDLLSSPPSLLAARV
jgi:hypothetical protein